MTKAHTSGSALQMLIAASRLFKLECQIAQSLCENIDSPRSLTVSLLMKNGEWGQLLDLKCESRFYSTVRAFEDDYLVTEIMSKNPRVPFRTEAEREEVAREAFLASESSCREANLRIEKLRYASEVPDADILSTLHLAAMDIQQCIGRSPDRKFQDKSAGFGPGSTTSLSRDVSLSKKFSRRVIDVTPRLLNRAVFALPPLWRQNIDGFKPVESSKLRFVPKNAKTKRAICIEPDLNIYFQKGLGVAIRDALRTKWSYDLDSQEWNQHLASIAHMYGLATVDLKAASDSICFQAILLLLPLQWTEALLECRTDRTSHKGVAESIKLEKWSSMGNGYTFELESLIFGALVRACVPMDQHCLTAVYGDDLILPDDCVDKLIRVLEFLGFKTNEKKTFRQGSLFFESCGTDWFQGSNVRPIYLRSELDELKFPKRRNTAENAARRSALISIQYANSIRRLANRRYHGINCDARLLPAWLRCYRTLPEGTPKGPDGVGDTHLICNFDECNPSRMRRGWEGYRYKTYRIRPLKTGHNPYGRYIANLHTMPELATYGMDSVRGYCSGITLSSGQIFDWPDLGPWAN